MNRSVALSIDVDELGLALADFYRWPSRGVPADFRATLRQVFRILAAHGAQCTLFVPGYLLQACPDALDDALDQGHEIACHGHRHVPLYTHRPDQFEEDVSTAVALIRKATGVSPVGYRAPGMTLLPVAGWATPILSKHGFLYSSSVPALPLRQHRYQVTQAEPFYWPCGLEELPVATQRILGLRVPICGSIYARYLPHFLTRLATERFFRRSKHPLFYYFHPFELFPESVPHWLRRDWNVRLYLCGCSRFRNKLEWLLAHHRCVRYDSARVKPAMRVAS